MRRLSLLTPLLFVTALAACDEVNSDLERAVVGGAIGCAAGQVLVNGRCAEGAVIGAGVGVVTN